MTEHTYLVLEVVGTAKTSIEDAISNALAAVADGKVLRWFEVLETRGYIEGDAVAYYQVKVKVGYHT